MQKKIPKNDNNVQITNFSASDSLAARKALLLRKSQNAQHPVRRTVPATAITSTNKSGDACEKKDVCYSCKENSLLPDTVSAVATATAAALSTQPLLSSQFKLESQLSLLLEKISTLEQEAALKQKELENRNKTEKIANLESQLQQVTEERMKNLELLQKQLFEMQTKFLRVAGNFQNMSHVKESNTLSTENQKPTETQCASLNSSLNTSNGQELKSNPSMSSGYQTLTCATLDPQKSFTDDKVPLGSEEYKCLNSVVTNVENIRTAKHSNIKNCGKSNRNNTVCRPTAKNISVRSVEKKPKVSDQKVTFSVKNPASSISTKSKRNVQTKICTDKRPSKNITQKNVSSVKNKVGSQIDSVNKINMHSKERPIGSDMKSSSDIKLSHLVPDSSRYSVLKDFVSGRYSQKPYVIREMNHVLKSATERKLNTSFTIDDHPIVEREDRIKEHISKVETKRPELDKETPLEKYILQSPDKSLLFTQDKIYSGQQVSLPSAEVLAGQEILRKAQTSRMVLEANLEMAERDNEKDAVYSFVDHLYEGSPAAHRLQLSRKVDECIAKVQKDIRNELSQAEGLNSLPNKTKNQKFISSSKGQKILPEKTINKVFVTKEKYRDSDYLAQVFGKAAYQNKRTTVKNPYMHFQNCQRAKSPRPKETMPVKGIQMRSAKTQTRQEKENCLKEKAFNQQPKTIDNKKYFFASSTTDRPNSINVQHGHLGHMAVSLREPRMDSGLKVPITIRAGDSLTMAPEDQPKLIPARNVTVCNIPVCDKEQVTTRRHALVKQTLPSVVIESQQKMIQPSKDFPCDSKLHAEEVEKKMTNCRNVMISDENVVEEFEDHSESSGSVLSSEEEVVEEEPLIVLSTSKPKITGGKVQKMTTELVEKRMGEDILDSLDTQVIFPCMPFVSKPDSPKESSVRHHLQNENLKWVEEEIVSQILSYQSNQPPMLPSNPNPLPSSDIFCKVADNVPQQDTFKSDANTPLPDDMQASINHLTSSFVDKTLISQLVEDLLVDKINEMLKDAKDENVHPVLPVSDPTSPQKESSSISEKPMPPKTPEMTPDVSERSLASPEPDVPFPQTPSASPEPLLEEGSDITKDLHQNYSSDLNPSLFHADLEQEINKLREEDQVIHREETKGDAPSTFETLITPERTPTLTPIPVGSPLTPVSSPPSQLILLNKNKKDLTQIRTPSPSIYDQDVDEEAADIQQDELQLTINLDEIPSIQEATQEEETSKNKIERAAADAKPNQNLFESLSPEETGSILTMTNESDTIFESVSGGQWVLSKSEGEAVDVDVGKKTYQQIANATSTASTLRDTEDLFQDETTEITYSEGEVACKSRVSPEKDMMLELASQMPNLNRSSLHYDLILQSNEEGKSIVHRSLGEIPLIESEPYLAKTASAKTENGHFLKSEEKSLKQPQPKLTEMFNSPADSQDEDDRISELEMYVLPKGARVIEVGKQTAKPSSLEPTVSKVDPSKQKLAPSQIESGSVSDTDQLNFIQKSVRFSKDSLLTSVDYTAYLKNSSDLATSDPEKVSASSSHKSVPSYDGNFQEKPNKKNRQMAVMIPQPDNISDEGNIDEISLGEEN